MLIESRQRESEVAVRDLQNFSGLSQQPDAIHGITGFIYNEKTLQGILLGESGMHSKLFFLACILIDGNYGGLSAS